MPYKKRERTNGQDKTTVSGVVTVEEAEELDRIARRDERSKSFHVGKAISQYLARLRRKVA